MQNEYVEHALARLLRVKRHQVGEWRITGQSSGNFMRSSVGVLGVTGQINADLTVDLAFMGGRSSAGIPEPAAQPIRQCRDAGDSDQPHIRRLPVAL